MLGAMQNSDWIALAGVIVNALGIAAIVWAAKSTVSNEMKKFEAQKRADARAEAALGLWRASRDLTVVMRSVCSPIIRPDAVGDSNETRTQNDTALRLTDLAESRNRFLAASADAELLIGRREAAIDELWRLSAEVSTCVRMTGAGMDARIKALNQLYDQLPDQIDAMENRVRVLLAPIVMVSKT
jgi:hypothetical protein